MERILNHKTERGKTVYRVKWLGWEKEGDMTWEPIDNLYVPTPDIYGDGANCA